MTQCLTICSCACRDEINLGIARLYCSPEGWDFRLALLPERDPRAFLLSEVDRLSRRFEQLTDLAFQPTIAADQMQIQAAEQEARMGLLPSDRGADIRHKLPRALLAMQRVIKTRPYPGRSRLMPSQVVLEGYQGHNIKLADVGLSSRVERQGLLAALAGSYGLPTCPQFESAACTFLLYERYSTARARFAVCDWIQEAVTSRPLPNAVLERLQPNVIRNITLRPLVPPQPLPALALLFPSSSAVWSEACRAEDRPASPNGLESIESEYVHIDPPILRLLRSTSGTNATPRRRSHEVASKVMEEGRSARGLTDAEAEELGWCPLKRHQTH